MAIVWLALAACGGHSPAGAPPAPSGTPPPGPSGTIPLELLGVPLAYVVGSATSADIFTALADGSNVRRLTYGPGIKSYPTWSPDGSRIAYRVETPDPQASTPDFDTDGTLIVAADGSTPTSVTRTSRVLGGFIGWSPDGTMLAVSGRHEGDPQHAESIWVMKVDGSGARRLTPLDMDAQQPSWSPDGRRIAFVSAEAGRFRIYVMNTDGTARRPLTDGPQDENPMWSPDGSMIAFFRGAGGPNLWLMKADGSGQKATDATTGRECGPPASWASSSFIALNCGGEGQGFVAAVRPDGSQFTVLLDGREASFPAFKPG
jgi:Tol biopolymer transport system component